MSVRSKVTLLCVLCILYLFVFTLPSLHSSQTIKESVEPSWRWQYDDHIEASRPAPPYRSPQPPSDNLLENNIITTSRTTTTTTTTTTNTNSMKNDVNDNNEMERSVLDPNEKFITFFTHSGFQNQLIQGTIHSHILLPFFLLFLYII